MCERFGLTAIYWIEREVRVSRREVRVSHTIGIAVFYIVCGSGTKSRYLCNVSQEFVGKVCSRFALVVSVPDLLIRTGAGNSKSVSTQREATVTVVLTVVFPWDRAGVGSASRAFSDAG